MKKYFQLVVIIILILTSFLVQGQVSVVSLNDGWQLKQVRGTNWYATDDMPACVHSTLIKQGIISDPYVDVNNVSIQWVDKEDWEYKKSFDVSADVFNKKNIILHFKGLDTYADVFLNGKKVLTADNMFTAWKVDVKDLLKDKNNELRILFHSPTMVGLKELLKYPYRYEAINDQSENGGMFDYRVSIFTRKAGYHYGWDWGPRIVTIGIWRPVQMEAWNNVKIEDTYFDQISVNSKKAEVNTKLSITSDENRKVTISIVDSKSNKTLAVRDMQLQSGENEVAIPFIINKPTLWWSNGLGEPHLYSLKALVASAADNNTIFDTTTTNVGLRDIRLVTTADAVGHTFHFELNGIPVFMKGANQIPFDNILTNLTFDDYKYQILAAKNANMNMIRVWGGGIYEDDTFYDLCDENGILVWQDFMFACSLYPADTAMLKNIRKEAEYNVKRLRNHACIALWCGNNENNEGIYNWGWLKRYEKQGVDQKILTEYHAVFNKLLPDIVNELTNTDYRSTSPINVPDGITSDTKSGDMHYWRIWGQREPIEEYNNVLPRFMSEFGFQSYPDKYTIRDVVTNPKDWEVYSEPMLTRQRARRGTELLEHYMKIEYGEPKDFETNLYLSQLLQSDAMKIAQEAHRRNMPYTMGSLYWQLNDSWPGISWSSIDYFGRYKAMYYTTKKAFAPIAVSAVVRNDSLLVYSISDKLKREKVFMTIKIQTLDGQQTFMNSQTEIMVQPNTSRVVFSAPLKTIINLNVNLKNTFIYVSLKKDGELLSENSYLQDKPVNLNLPKSDIKSKLNKQSNGHYLLELSSPTFAKGVFIDVDSKKYELSDNYFNMLPDEKKQIVIIHKSGVSKQLENIEIHHYWSGLTKR